MSASLVVSDTSPVRAIAKHLGILPIGVLGTLVRSKQRGLITSVRPLLDRLQNEIDCFVSDALRAQILEMADETIPGLS